jgi:hypothetical protein
MLNMRQNPCISDFGALHLFLYFVILLQILRCSAPIFISLIVYRCSHRVVNPEGLDEVKYL